MLAASAARCALSSATWAAELAACAAVLPAWAAVSTARCAPSSATWATVLAACFPANAAVWTVAEAALAALWPTANVTSRAALAATRGAAIALPLMRRARGPLVPRVVAAGAGADAAWAGADAARADIAGCDG